MTTTYAVLDVNGDATGLEYDSKTDALARADKMVGGHVVPVVRIAVVFTVTAPTDRAEALGYLDGSVSYMREVGDDLRRIIHYTLT